VSEPIDPKVIEEVYLVILAQLRSSAHKWRKPLADAEDIAVETITRMLERHEKEAIYSPLHWARKTAMHVWREFGRRQRKNVSYEGVKGQSLHGGYNESTVDRGSGERVQRPTEPWERGKISISRHARYEMLDAVTDPRSPELLAEQRDFIQKIDPDWKAHMEEGFDFDRGKKLDRNIRRQIKRRAASLLGEKSSC
jgi:DNA-directed RNA polymerase specialized sigma24 family protein